MRGARDLGNDFAEKSTASQIIELEGVRVSVNIYSKDLVSFCQKEFYVWMLLNDRYYPVEYGCSLFPQRCS